VAKHNDQNDSKKSFLNYNEANKFYEEMGHYPMVGLCKSNCACILLKARDYDEAEVYFSNAIEKISEVPNALPGIQMLNNLVKMSRLFQCGYVCYAKIENNFSIKNLLDLKNCQKCDK